MLSLKSCVIEGPELVGYNYVEYQTREDPCTRATYAKKNYSVGDNSEFPTEKEMLEHAR